MNDAEFDTQKNRVAALITKWAGMLGLGKWDIEYDYRREHAEEANADTVSEILFTASADWSYQNALITAYLPVIAKYPDEQLEKWTVHELCHILTNELRPANNNDWLAHAERVCTDLARSFLKVWQEGYESGFGQALSDAESVNETENCETCEHEHCTCQSSV
jgi:hypothetical protein